MAPRKETPDLLAEMLGAEMPAETPAAVLEGLSGQPPKPKRPAATKPRSTRPKGWEYILVSFQDYKGWRPRYENGRENKNWMELPPIHQYVNDLSSEGWELVTSSAGERMYGSADRYQLFFKRVKSK